MALVLLDDASVDALEDELEAVALEAEVVEEVASALDEPVDEAALAAELDGVVVVVVASAVEDASAVVSSSDESPHAHASASASARVMCTYKRSTRRR